VTRSSDPSTRSTYLGISEKFWHIQDRKMNVECEWLKEREYYHRRTSIARGWVVSFSNRVTWWGHRKKRWGIYLRKKRDNKTRPPAERKHEVPLHKPLSKIEKSGVARDKQKGLFSH